MAKRGNPCWNRGRGERMAELAKRLNAEPQSNWKAIVLQFSNEYLVTTRKCLEYFQILEGCGLIPKYNKKRFRKTTLG